MLTIPQLAVDSFLYPIFIVASPASERHFDKRIERISFFFFFKSLQLLLEEPACRGAAPPPTQPSPSGAGGTSPSPGILLPSPLHLHTKVRAAGSDYFSHDKFLSLQALLPTRFPIFQARASQQARAASSREAAPRAGTGPDPAAGGHRGGEEAAQGTPWGPPGRGEAGLRSAAASSFHRLALAACRGTEEPIHGSPSCRGATQEPGRAPGLPTEAAALPSPR